MKLQGRGPAGSRISNLKLPHSFGTLKVETWPAKLVLTRQFIVTFKKAVT
jgi:hypothetical protein